jgi:isopenicillin-N epimerase
MEQRYRLLQHIETEPVRFYSREIYDHIDRARDALAGFLGADPEGLVFVPNATTGVNTVLKSLHFGPGDEILTTDHVYNACNNVAELVARRAGAKVVTVHIPFPAPPPTQVAALILAAVTPRTRLLLIDHITSPTALIFPVEQLARELEPRGVEVLVDGAHAPGMVPLDLRGLGASYYTGNCHKWMCAPKGSAFLYLREDVRSKVRPLTISHGANSPRRDRSFLRLEFDWTGTGDPTPYIVIPQCIEFMQGLYPEGPQRYMRRNHELAVWAMEYLCGEFGVPQPCAPDMMGSMALAPILPPWQPPASAGLVRDPVGERLFEEHKIEVPITRWPGQDFRAVRVSAQAYNSEDDYRRLAGAVREILG